MGVLGHEPEAVAAGGQAAAGRATVPRQGRGRSSGPAAGLDLADDPAGRVLTSSRSERTASPSRAQSATSSR